MSNEQNESDAKAHPVDTLVMQDAPSNSLPNWSECNLRMANAKYLNDNGLSGDDDSLLPNPIHEFIYEYDDADAYRSAWFMHRLEKLIEFVKSAA